MLKFGAFRLKVVGLFLDVTENLQIAVFVQMGGKLTANWFHPWLLKHIG